MHIGTSNDDYDLARVFLPGPLFVIEATPWVVYFHGATANEQQVLISTGSNTGPNTMLNSWLDRGWGVISLRLGTTGVVDPYTDNNDGKWGNAPMRDGAANVPAWINRFASLPGRGLLIYGFSAGGTNSLNTLLEWTYRSQQPVAGAVLVDPAVNLRWCYDSGTATTAGIPGSSGASGPIHNQIKAAYAIPNGTHTPGAATTSTWGTLVDADRNGHDTAEIVPTGQFPSVPLLISSSTGDSLIKKAYNADVLVARLNADGRWGGSGLELTVLTTGGAHGANSHFSPTLHNAFFTRALAR